MSEFYNNADSYDIHNEDKKNIFKDEEGYDFDDYDDESNKMSDNFDNFDNFDNCDNYEDKYLFNDFEDLKAIATNDDFYDCNINNLSYTIENIGNLLLRSAQLLNCGEVSFIFDFNLGSFEKWVETAKKLNENNEFYKNYIMLIDEDALVCKYKKCDEDEDEDGDGDGKRDGKRDEYRKNDYYDDEDIDNNILHL